MAYGQTVLVPYRSGKLWGLADTMGRVKLVPAYDQVDAESYVNRSSGLASAQFFVVRKGTKYGVLNQSKLVMLPKFHQLRVDSVFIKENNNVKNSVRRYTSPGS